MYMQQIEENKTRITITEGKVINIADFNKSWGVSAKMETTPPRYFAAMFSKSSFPTLRDAIAQVFLQLSDWIFTDLTPPPAEHRGSPLPDPDKYNGWKNYQTWCVFTWITNTEIFDAYARILCANAEKNHINAGDELRLWVESRWHHIHKTPDIFTDLIENSLSHVDFDSIAAHYLV